MADKRRPTFFELCDAFERQLIEQALADNYGSVADAARSLGLTEHGLELKIARLLVLPRRPRELTPRGEW